MGTEEQFLQDDQYIDLDLDYEGDISEELESEEIDTDPYKYDLDIFSEPTAIGELIEKFQRGLIKIPDFQRPYVWDAESRGHTRHKPSLFIDSVLLGLPIPSIVLYRPDPKGNKEIWIVDGQQRLKTLLHFKYGKEGDKGFALRGSDIDKQWFGKSYEDLAKDQESINDIFNYRKIPVVYIHQLKPDTPDRPTSIYKLFDRLNSGGMELHAHEIRMALSFQNIDSEQIFKLLKSIDVDFHLFWIELFPRSYCDSRNYGKRMEVYFRILVSSFFYKEFRRPLRRFLDECAYKKTKEYTHTLEEIKSALFHTVDILQQYFRQNQLLFKPKSRFNFKLFETVFAGLFQRRLQGLPVLSNTSFFELFDSFKVMQYHATDKSTNETLFKLQYEMAN